MDSCCHDFEIQLVIQIKTTVLQCVKEDINYILQININVNVKKG